LVTLSGYRVRVHIEPIGDVKRKRKKKKKEKEYTLILN
jgi:hypothetical protein